MLVVTLWTCVKSTNQDLFFVTTWVNLLKTVGAQSLVKVTQNYIETVKLDFFYEAVEDGSWGIPILWKTKQALDRNRSVWVKAGTTHKILEQGFKLSAWHHKFWTKKKKTASAYKCNSLWDVKTVYLLSLKKILKICGCWSEMTETIEIILRTCSKNKTSCHGARSLKYIYLHFCAVSITEPIIKIISK